MLDALSRARGGRVLLSAARCLALFGLLAVGATSRALQGAVPHDTKPRFRALVFSKAAGFRHASIPNAIAAIRDLAAKHNFSVDASEDASAFTDENLRKYQVVVF